MAMISHFCWSGCGWCAGWVIWSSVLVGGLRGALDGVRTRASCLGVLPSPRLWQCFLEGARTAGGRVCGHGWKREKTMSGLGESLLRRYAGRLGREVLYGDRSESAACRVASPFADDAGFEPADRIDGHLLSGKVLSAAQPIILVPRVRAGSLGFRRMPCSDGAGGRPCTKGGWVGPHTVWLRFDQPKSDDNRSSASCPVRESDPYDAHRGGAWPSRSFYGFRDGVHTKESSVDPTTNGGDRCGLLVPPVGFEPTTQGLKDPCSDR